MTEVERLGVQSVVEVAHSLLVPNALRLTTHILRLGVVDVAHVLAGRHGKGFGHDGRLRRHGSEASLVVSAEGIPVAQLTFTAGWVATLVALRVATVRLSLVRELI